MAITDTLSSIGTILQVIVGVLILGAFLLLIVLGSTVALRDSVRKPRWRREREEQLSTIPRVAQQLGGRYTHRDDQWLSVIDVLRRFGTGEVASRVKNRADSSRSAYGYRFEVNPTAAAEHVITVNHNGRECVVFQHRANQAKQRTKPGTRDTREFYWEADADSADYGVTVATRLPKTTPMVCVTRRWRGAISGLVGRDTNLEHHGFNRKYLVFMENRRFGYDVVNQSMMSWILESHLPKEVFLVVVDGWCIISRQDILRADEIKPHLDQLMQFASNIPQHVWSVDYNNSP